ncbi:MAG: von Willebrand factor type A domain-containing protein, partial [Planctomycetales bacterium]|nr:von Willebrand factor type A domain-containing protein [Planctomycetales bacterium]
LALPTLGEQLAPAPAGEDSAPASRQSESTQAGQWMFRASDLGSKFSTLSDEIAESTQPQGSNSGSESLFDVPLDDSERQTETFDKRIAGRELYGVPVQVESRQQIESRQVPVPADVQELDAGTEPFSTFSLHVSDVAFELARTALAQNEWPKPETVRIEEFVNAFDYGDPLPSGDEKVSCTTEQSIHPALQQRNMLRVAIRTAAAGRAANTPLNLCLLLDNSGSMERPDRQQTVRRAFNLLAAQLKPNDQVTLISFARQPRLLADNFNGEQAAELVTLVDGLSSEGGTNVEAALSLAFEKAKEHQVAGAQNRIVLLTDGAVNLGDANPENLSQMVTRIREAGIAFDAAGISAAGLNDQVLEALTRRGDGRYYLLDSAEATNDRFANQVAGALRPSAKNVKVQIEFNPQRVGNYRLLGFEQHRLEKEDFHNDQVDAAEMAATEAGVALYQFEAKPDGAGDVGSVSVRFQDLDTGDMVERRWPIPYEPSAPRPDQASASLRLAMSASLLAAKLRSDPLGEQVPYQTLNELVTSLPTETRNVPRVQQLEQMLQQASQIGTP